MWTEIESLVCFKDDWLECELQWRLIASSVDFMVSRAASALDLLFPSLISLKSLNLHLVRYMNHPVSLQHRKNYEINNLTENSSKLFHFSHKLISENPKSLPLIRPPSNLQNFFHFLFLNKVFQSHTTFLIPHLPPKDFSFIAAEKLK